MAARIRLTAMERITIAAGLEAEAAKARAAGEKHLAEQMERGAKVVRAVGNTPTAADVRAVRFADVALQAWTLLAGGRR